MNGKWMLTLLSRKEQKLIQRLERNDRIRRFTEIATVDVGIVTGANKFFLVPDAVVEQYGLEKWAHPMFGRSNHVSGVVYDEATHQKQPRQWAPY